MDSGLLTQVSAYDTAFAAVLTARETYLHANKNSGQTNEEYTEALEACAEAFLLWWEHDKRAAIANGYIQALAGYVTQMLMMPDAVPQLLPIDHTPTALMDQGNFIGQFKAALHSIYLDPTGPGGVALTEWAEALELQIANEPAELARYSARYSAKTEALLTMTNFEDVAFLEIPRSQVRDYIFTTLGWTSFLKGVSGLHDVGIYAYPRENDFELAILEPTEIDGPDPDIYAIQFITPGIVPFFIREAILDTLFSADDVTNTLSWGAGTAYFMTDTNQPFYKSFNGGSIQYTGQKIYVAYSFLLDDLITTTNPLTAYQSGQIICAIYGGDFNLVTRNARQSIRGTDIISRSTPPDRLADGDLPADIRVGTVNGPLIMGSGSRIQLGTNADPLMFIGRHMTDGFEYASGYYFRTNDGNTLFDSIDGLAADTVGSLQIRPGSVQEHHLDFGNRTIQEEGIVVSVAAMENIVSWSSGVVVWVDDLGNTVTTEILAGNAFYEGVPVFVTWTPGEDHFETTTDPEEAYDDGVYIFLTYNGGSNVARNFSSTIIDGNRIRTNSIAANRIQAESAFLQTLYVGGERFMIDGANTRMDIRDTNGTLRARIGQQSNNPLDHGITMWDQFGNIVLLNGSTVSYGRVDTQLGEHEDTLADINVALSDLADDVNIVTNIYTQVGEDITDMQAQIDNLLDNIGDIEGEALNAARIELELFRGFRYIGALGNLDFIPNADGDPGLLRVDGEYFDHPELGEINPTTPVQFRIPWIAHLAPPGRWFTVIWSEEAVSTRFPGASIGSGNFFPALLTSDVWRAYTHTSLVGVGFTPRQTDVVCAIFSKKPELNGVDNVNSYIRETQVINSRFDEIEAVVGGEGDDPDDEGSIFARISNLGVVIANESYTRATQYSLLETQLGDAESSIETLQQTTADTNEAFATYQIGIDARFDTAESNISENATAVSNAVSSIASQGTTLRSEMSRLNYDSFTKNPSFSNYETTPGAPNDWTSNGSPTITRVTGVFSSYGARVTTAGNVAGGLYQQHTGIPNGKYNIEFATKLFSGAYTGGGVRLTKSDNSQIAAYSFHNTADANGDISTSKTGVRVFRPPVLNISTTDGVVNVYLYSHNSTFGQAITAANAIEFHQFMLRSIDAIGVELANVQANISTNYFTKTEVTGQISSAAAGLQTEFSSYIDQELSTLSSTISSTYYTKTETDGAIDTATGVIADEIGSIVSNEIDAVNSNLTTNYYTRSQTDGAISTSISTAQTTLRSEIARVGNSLTKNSSFTNYPTTPGAPADWTSTGSPGTIVRATGIFSAYAVRVPGQAGSNGGITQQITGIPSGKYMVEFATVLSSGSYVGSGIRLTRNSDNAVIVSYPLATTPDSGGVTSSSQAGLRTYRPAEFDYTSTDGIINVQLWAHQSAFGSVAAANSIEFHQIIFRPISAEKAAVNTVNANLSTNYLTSTQTTNNISTAISNLSNTLTTYIDGEVGDINSLLTTNYSTTGQMDDAIASSTASLDTTLRSYINAQDSALNSALSGQINSLSSTLNTNYSTTTQMNAAIVAATGELSTSLTSYIDTELDAIAGTGGSLAGQIDAIEANLSTNYLTTTQVTDSIATSVAEAVTDLTSYIDGEVTDVNSNLTTNFYTRTQTDGVVSTSVANATTALRSEIGGSVVNLLANGQFSNYPTTPGLPTGWSPWNTATITRVAGKLSAYGVRIVTTANTNGGFTQQITGLPTGKYMIEIAASLISGNWNGAGVRITRNSDNAVVAAYHLAATADTNGLVSSTQTGLRFFRPDEFTHTATNGTVDIVVAGHHSNLGTIAVANMVEIHQITIVPINAAKLANNSLSATLTNNYSTTTAQQAYTNSAVSQASTNLTSYIDGEIEDLNDALQPQINTLSSTLSTDYYTKTATEGYADTAVANASTALRSEIAGSTVSLTRNPTLVNYPTATGAPPSWSSVGSPTLARVTGKISPNAVQITAGASVAGSLLQQLTGLLPGKYSLEFTTALNSGNYTGAGILLTDSNNTTIASFPAGTIPDINNETSLSKAGVRFFRPAEFQINTPGNNGIVNVYMAAHHASLGAISAANSVIFHQVDLRPVSAAQQAATAVGATLSNNYSTTTQMNQAITTAKSEVSQQLTSYVDDSVDDLSDVLQPQINTVNSNLSTNYSTTAQTTDLINTTVASAKSELSSVIAGSSSGLVRNPTFINYPTSTGAPPDYSSFGTPTLSRVSGKISPNAVRIASTAGGAAGLLTQLTGIPNGKYFIEFATLLDSGTYVGAGILITNSAGGVIQAFPISTLADVAGVTSNTQTGLRFFRPAEFNVTTTSGNGIVNIYVLAHSSTLGAISAANTVTFHQIDFGPINATQKLATDTSANLSTNYFTATQTNDAITVAKSEMRTELRAYADQSETDAVAAVNSNLSTNYSTTAVIDGKILTAKSELREELEAYADGAAGDVLSTLTNSYSTTSVANEYVNSTVGQAKTDLRSEISGVSASLTKNPMFANYPLTTGAPPEWASNGSATITRIAGKLSPFAPQVAAPANQNAALLAQLTGVPNGKYLLEFATQLVSGSYLGSGIRLVNSAGGTIASFPASTLADLNGDISSSKAGVRYFTPPEFTITTTSGNGIVNVYAAAHDSTLGAITAANSIAFHQVQLKPTSAANTANNTLSANLSNNYYTKTQVYTQGETASFVSAAIAGFDLSANTTFNNLSSSVGIQGEAISTLEESSAILNLVAAASGGNPAIFSLKAGIEGAVARIISDKFSILNSGTGGTLVTALEAINGIVKIINKLSMGANNEIEFDPAIPAIIFGFGATKLVLGKNFGASSNLTFWFGPNIAISSMTKTNATFWFDNAGDAYFGGSFSAGVLSQSVSNPALVNNAQVTTGSFGSNGGTIQVAYSITSSGGFVSGPGHGIPTGNGNGTNSAFVDLYRSIGGGAESLVGTIEATGTWEYEANPGDAVSQWNFSGSGTFTDPTLSTQNRTYRAVLRNVVINSPVDGYSNVKTQRLSIVTSEE